MFRKAKYLSLNLFSYQNNSGFFCFGLFWFFVFLVFFYFTPQNIQSLLNPHMALNNLVMERVSG